VQARVLDWIEFGLPFVLPSAVRGGVRWFASAGVDATRLDPRLSLAFAELTIRTLPLRERPGVIDAFVADTSRAWSAARREPPKAFDPLALDLLRDEPWPGNLAELEAVVIRSLAHAPADAETIRLGDLCFDPEVTAAPTATPVAEAPASIEPEVETPTAEAVATTTELLDENPVARLAAEVAHEVRNPLVSIRTFSELLHDHYADPEFRDRFGRLVAEDVRRIEGVIERLEQMGEAPPRAPSAPIDMTALLEGLLDEQRPHIQSKRLLVLKELDRARPLALGDEPALRAAIAGLLDHAIAEVPERGDLYLASRHQPNTGERATMRILLRYRVAPGRTDPALPTAGETDLGRSVAENVIRNQGGSMTVDTGDAFETLVTIDLPAPGRTRN
jgi:signal transduction histidine kinase